MECNYCGSHVDTDLATWRGDTAYHEFCEDKMNATKPFQLGSISSGTLRTEDLLPAFANKAESLGWKGPRKDKARSLDEVIAMLTEVLENYCPPFVYFGAHPGDGADFGFWPDMDALQEIITLDNLEVPTAETWEVKTDAVIVSISGPVNITVMDSDRNVLWSTV